MYNKLTTQGGDEMIRLILMIATFMTGTKTMADINTGYDISITRPFFITVHANQNRAIRLNVNAIRSYKQYYPYDDIYFKTEIVLVDGGSMDVTEDPTEIDLMLMKEVSKPTNEKPKTKNRVLAD